LETGGVRKRLMSRNSYDQRGRKLILVSKKRLLGWY